LDEAAAEMTAAETTAAETTAAETTAAETTAAETTAAECARPALPLAQERAETPHPPPDEGQPAGHMPTQPARTPAPGGTGPLLRRHLRRPRSPTSRSRHLTGPRQ